MWSGVMEDDRVVNSRNKSCHLGGKQKNTIGEDINSQK